MKLVGGSGSGSLTFSDWGYRGYFSLRVRNNRRVEMYNMGGSCVIIIEIANATKDEKKRKMSINSIKEIDKHKVRPKN